MTARADMQIRVLAGRARGAAQSLPQSGRVRLGSSFAADIVLREPGAPAFAAELLLEPGQPPRLAVLEGDLNLLGTPLAAGAGIVWPQGVPLAIGPIVVALGPDDPDAADWQAAEALAAARPGVAAAPDTASPAIAHTARGPAARLADYAGDLKLRVRMPSQMLLSGGVIAAALAALALGPVPVLPRFGDPVDAAGRLLAESGHHGLQARADSSGVIAVSGIVDDEAARARVAATLDRAGIAHELDLQTGDQLLRMAVDVARLQGVPARARRLGMTAIELTTTPLSPEARQALVAALRRDVPALGQVRIVDGLVPVDPAPPRTVSEAAKRVATVVAGNPGYVLTADGARYFPGAVLPSGHRLVAVEPAAIRVESSGRETLIRF
jgi:type III secretion protein D